MLSTEGNSGERPLSRPRLLAAGRFLRVPYGSLRPRWQRLTSRPIIPPSTPRFPLGAFLCPDPSRQSARRFGSLIRAARAFRAPFLPSRPIHHAASRVQFPTTPPHATSNVLPLRPHTPAPGSRIRPYPIRNSEFGNRESGTPEARCMERYRRFRSPSSSFRLTAEHGTVGWAHHRMVRCEKQRVAI